MKRRPRGSDDTVSVALLNLERWPSLRWPLPLVEAIELSATGSATAWICSLIRTPSLHTAATRFEDVELYLKMLESPRHDPSRFDALLKAAQDVWYLGGGRDIVRTAVSRVCEANAALEGGDTKAYRRLLAVAVGVLATDADELESRRRVKVVIESFQELQSE